MDLLTTNFLGTFDVVVELLLFTFMIVWRIKSYNHLLLSRLAHACCVWVLLGATVETAITIWLLKSSWGRWGLPFRILLPVLFSLWISTQLYGAYRILGMARSKSREAKGEPQVFSTHHNEISDLERQKPE